MIQSITFAQGKHILDTVPGSTLVAVRTEDEYGAEHAAGAVLLTPTGRGPQVGAVCFGRVRDFDVTDINNMGAAMAPAAAETLLRFFARSGRRPEDYDAIYTGDLGFVGSRLLLEILQRENVSSALVFTAKPSGLRPASL